MTVFTLVRHGQTDWNIARRYQGQKDIPLNEEGLRQAQQLASQLNGRPFDAIYSSDLLRALKTAEILHIGRDIPLRTDIRLREICFGEWEGEVFSEMYAKYPERFTQSRANPAIVMAPGGESVAQVAERTTSFANDVSQLYPLGKVLVVTHGMALATLYCRANGLPLTDAHNRIPDNAIPVEISWEATIK